MSAISRSIHNKPETSSYYPVMNLVRYLLSLAVIIAHINELIGSNLPFPISSYEAVGGFFALSRFLMYPNYLRHNNFKSYTLQRARRILPPYIFIVVLAAFSLSLISNLPFRKYFLSSDFYAYLAANLSFLNWLHPTLPGVFDGMPFKIPAVNASLWTMKVEWCLYFSVPIFIYILSHVKWIGRQSLAIAVILLSISYCMIFNCLYETSGKEIFNILSRQVFGQLLVNGVYYMFYCNAHNIMLMKCRAPLSGNDVSLSSGATMGIQSTNAETVKETSWQWTEPKALPVNWGSLHPWHIDVLVEDDNVAKMIVCGFTEGNNSNSADLYYLTYDLHTGDCSEPRMILARSKNSKDLHWRSLYRSSLLKIDDTYYVYFSCISKSWKRHMSLAFGTDLSALQFHPLNRPLISEEQFH